MDQYDSDGLGGLFDVPDQVLLDAQAPRRPVVESALPPVRGDRAELLIASGTLRPVPGLSSRGGTVHLR